MELNNKNKSPVKKEKQDIAKQLKECNSAFAYYKQKSEELRKELLKKEQQLQTSSSLKNFTLLKEYNKNLKSQLEKVTKFLLEKSKK